MMDVLDGAGEYGAFGLFTGAAGDDPTKLVYTIVDVSPTAAFNFFLGGVSG